MRIGGNIGATNALAEKKNAAVAGKRLAEMGYGQAVSQGNTAWNAAGNRFRALDEEEGDDSAVIEQAGGERSEAEKIYQAAVAGKPNPWGSMREVSKVPYGHLAKDGVIEYNGVCFVCDEKTNSICLGDMTDEKNVLNIPLSGGGHLKVNRNSIGLLSKAAGMFSPEDLNLIMRAITEDAKIQSVKKEIEDEEASVGNQLRADEGAQVEEGAEAEEE